MRREMFVAVLLGASLVTGILNAQEIKQEQKPPCECLSCIHDVLKQNKIENVVRLEAKKDHWVGEAIDQNGKRSQIIVRCEPADKSKKKISSCEMKTPPTGGKTMGEIIAIVKKMNQGKIKEVEFRNGRWFVATFDDHNLETDLVFDANGVIVTTEYTD